LQSVDVGTAEFGVDRPYALSAQDAPMQLMQGRRQILNKVAFGVGLSALRKRRSTQQCPPPKGHNEMENQNVEGGMRATTYTGVASTSMHHTEYLVSWSSERSAPLGDAQRFGGPATIPLQTVGVRPEALRAVLSDGLPLSFLVLFLYLRQQITS